MPKVEVHALYEILTWRHFLCNFPTEHYYTNLSPADLTEAAFDLCAYEFAIKAVNSPWCQLFDESDAKVGAISGQQYVDLK